ncbi:MAG TPA: DUF2098 domain-containing protein [Methanothermococcus okinawensis]|uniref:DUF2098 domain-containing protein n=1 Tax=Methanothermococcus okinawensis TaxID=155863 RepID=A0A833E074_9EURY|nr:DUF2098 domain-containing protein [Methanococcaceae archaeon]HIP84829.1 DUF2098 domain-containing protein [Methanothermococcus okinawensis]HIP90717.1 DUF2098 domain-containing protein [Methanothermococcus okinawensis]
MTPVLDVRGREISIGSYVRYINTGTTGIVRDILEREGRIWVLLDNDLMYRPDKLEVIQYREKRERKGKEEIEDILDREKVEEIESNIDPCGAG